MWTQAPSDLGLHCLSKTLYTTKADDLCCIGALNVNKRNGQDFHKMHARLLKHVIHSLPKRKNPISLPGQMK